MSYNVYLAEFEQKRGRDHHAVFVASTTSEDQRIGTLYHVTGDPGIGMDHKVKRNFNIEGSKSLLHKSKVGTISASRIQEFEILIPTIPAPHDPNALFGSPPAEDCQHWGGKLTAAAVKVGIIEKTE
jgi:hypothetical protein